jgi:small conductance mechanosensitive channel
MKLLWSIVALLVWWKIIRLVLFTAKQWFYRLHTDLSVRKFTLSALRIVLWVVLLISIARTLWVETTSLVALVGAAWLAIGLALQGSLQNVAWGLLIMLLKPFLVGESIEINTLSGHVDAINLFTTTLITADKKLITIPNSVLANGTVTNISRLATRRVDIQFILAYGTDLAHCKNVLTQIVQTHPQVLKDPEPSIHITLLADQGVQWIVRVFVHRDAYLSTFYDLNEQIYKAMHDFTILTPALQKLQKESRLQ